MKWTLKDLFRMPAPRLGTLHLDRLLGEARLRREHRHLEHLPDYLLRDMGLTREDVRRELAAGGRAATPARRRAA